MARVLRHKCTSCITYKTFLTILISDKMGPKIKKTRLKRLSVRNIYSMPRIKLCSSSKALTSFYGANSSRDAA